VQNERLRKEKKRKLLRKRVLVHSLHVRVVLFLRISGNALSEIKSGNSTPLFILKM